MEFQFDMWSGFHYFMIFFPFILAFGLYFLLKNKSAKQQQIVAIVIAVIMNLILLMRSIYMIKTRGGLNPEAIPFQVCHFANIVFLIVAITKSKVVGAIGWCLNFPAGFVSVVFANSLENYSNILSITGVAYIAGHMLIVTIAIYMLLVNIIDINLKTFGKVYLYVGVMYVMSVFINNWFIKLFAHTNTKANYFYSFKPEEGTPLETFFELGENVTVLGITFNPIYLILLGFTAAILFVVMYGIYLLKNYKGVENTALNLKQT